VPLPDGAVFVIANSLVEANKYVTASTNFNMRVVECRLAALVLAAVLNLPPCTRLRQVMQSSGLSLSALAEVVQTRLHTEPYSLAEVAQLLGMQEVELQSTHVGAVRGPNFALHQRALHVFQEANRVYRFRDACRTPSVEQVLELGLLMNESHASCSKLFDCSCPELDSLTDICRGAGALGSRLTGAGWGGCSISLVPQEKLGSFLARVQQEYFGQRLGLDAAAVAAQHALFVSRASSGAAIFHPRPVDV